MRRIRYSVAASLDGYIAAPDGSFDWIIEEEAIDVAAFTAKIDTLLMGRGTYEVMRAQDPPDPFPGMATYVFSRTLRPEEHPDVTVVAQGAADVVASLKAQPGKDIWLFGGGVLFRSLLQAGLVDTVEVAVIPVILGDGVPLLPGPELRTRLSLRKHEAFPSGIMLLKYDVGGDAG